MQEILGIGLRLAFMYLYALTLVRLTGKRSIGSLTALDFIATLIVGDMFDNVIWGETAVSSGLVGMGTVLVIHTLFAYLGYALPAFDRYVIGSYPVAVVKDGRWEKQGMRRERLSEDQGWSHLRKMSEDKLEEVRVANIEPGGHLALLKKEAAKTAQRKDLGRLLKRFK